MIPVNLVQEEFYLIRRPVLSVDVIFILNEETKGDIRLLKKALKRIYLDEFLQEAIYTASPDLHVELQKFLYDETYSNEKIVYTLYKYYVRMCTRCTPYGLFAGCSYGEPVANKRICMVSDHKDKHSRLDMNYVCELIMGLLADRTVREKISYIRNDSLYPIEDAWRYLEHRTQQKRRKYFISSALSTEYLSFILEITRNYVPFEEMRERLQAFDTSLESNDIEAFLHDLIDAQVLTSELDPTLTGGLFFEKMLSLLEGRIPTGPLQLLNEISDLLRKGGIDNFKKVHHILVNHFIKSSSKDLIQTDLFFPDQEVGVPKDVLQHITEQLSALFALSTKFKQEQLTRFKRAFLARYEEKEMPLLQVLDAELGIGYGSGIHHEHLPLVDGIKLGKEYKPKTLILDKYAKLIDQLYDRAKAANKRVVTISEQDLTGFLRGDISQEVPASLYALGSILMPDQTVDAIEPAFMFNLGTLSGPSAANLLGRFCHGSQKLTEKVRESIAVHDKDTSDYIYAEVVHLPEARVGNILMRPHLRAYEIPVLTKSDLSDPLQISLDDIMVSIVDDEIILRSKRLNKRVIPRLSTAHNYSMDGLPVYKFLCELQKDNKHSGIYWSWEHRSSAKFLPRVQYKNIILSKAAWQINWDDLFGSKTDVKDKRNALSDYIREQEISSHVCITEFDNELFVDLATSIGIELVLSYLQKKKTVKLTEFLFTPENCFVKTGEGNAFSHEIIIPLTNPLHQEKKYRLDNNINHSVIKRSFLPGSEWLYYKIYGGTKTVDKILTEVLKPIVDRLEKENIIDQWFYIRYGDPDHHIRLRLHLADVGRSFEIMQYLNTQLDTMVNSGVLAKVQIDTYHRELERYGHAHIVHAEQLFFYDSKCSIAVLDHLGGDEGEQFRWLLCMKGLDLFVDAFGLDFEGKIVAFERLSFGFFQEFGGDKSLKIQLNDKYRSESKKIASFLNTHDDEMNGISEITALFLERNADMETVIVAIKNEYQDLFTVGTAGFSSFASYIHMYVNRFFTSKPRFHELLIYTFLYKYYISKNQLEKRKGEKIAKMDREMTFA